MNKISLAKLVTVSIMFCAHSSLQARGGGDAFAGSLGGSLIGSMAGTAIASKSSSRDRGGDAEALRAVYKLEAVMAKDLTTLNDKLDKLEGVVNDDVEKDIKDMQKSLDTVTSDAKDIHSKLDDFEKRISALEPKKVAVETPGAAPAATATPIAEKTEVTALSTKPDAAKPGESVEKTVEQAPEKPVEQPVKGVAAEQAAG